MLARSHPDVAAKLLEEAQEDVDREWRVYSARAAVPGRLDPKAIPSRGTTKGTCRSERRMIIAPNVALIGRCRNDALCGFANNNETPIEQGVSLAAFT